MKNKIIALIIIITCFLIVCIGKVVDGSQKNRSDFYLPGNALKDEYGTKYEKEWKSSDNRICFIMDNKLEFYGRSHYHGTYLDPNNMTHKIFVECEPLND